LGNNKKALKQVLVDIMTNYIQVGGLQVARTLHQLVEEEFVQGTGIDARHFWAELESVFSDLGPINKQLLKTRDEMQLQIDQWHREHKDRPHDPVGYKALLERINYLQQDVEDFHIGTENVDAEIAMQAGPQLVVPVKNARFALNAANARWGSLYDALYGTDAISEDGGAENAGEYNPARGAKVIAFAKAHLDTVAPLSEGSHADVASYSIKAEQLSVALKTGIETSLVDANVFVGFIGSQEQPTSILFKHNGLHVEVQIDPSHLIGSTDAAGVKDVVVEAALTTIMDCEDSVAAVDAEDKVEVYRNWLGLMRGTLSASFNKSGKQLQRTLEKNRSYTTPSGEELNLHGRSLMFVRNVGHLMTNPAILNANGEEIPEGILDGMMTSFAALHDLKNLGELNNSRTGSIYIVKPKMHGPEEVAFTVTLFERIEHALSLPENTLKVGIMDEERRTSLNLKSCIFEAKDRVVFINTGFLDRTGDELHTSMQAGVMIPKAQMKQSKWIAAYENNNVDVGLQCGLSGRAQIGKGMWAMPDEMANMLEQKIMHPQSGANTAWVPSPNGATLHSTHYHQVNVFELQKEIAQREAASKDDILDIPLLADPSALTKQQIQNELDNNAQGILGYVVRWVEQGVGCSKVPDINNVGLMEDRATLRISSQHMTNWLLHGVADEAQVIASMKKMAAVVDKQNASDPDYVAMCTDLEASVAFQAALDLVLKGVEQPNGYTEPLLHAYRLKVKANQ